MEPHSVPASLSIPSQAHFVALCGTCGTLRHSEGICGTQRHFAVRYVGTCRFCSSLGTLQYGNSGYGVLRLHTQNKIDLKVLMREIQAIF